MDMKKSSNVSIGILTYGNLLCIRLSPALVTVTMIVSNELLLILHATKWYIIYCTPVKPVTSAIAYKGLDILQT